MEGLSALVKPKYNAAKACKALIFSATELTVVRFADFTFQLRYCPALANKPTTQNDTPSSKKIDPFENPSPQLLIASIPKSNPSHNLVLNKYPVIPNHFILATKINKQQTEFLEAEDVGLTYQCLTEWAKHQSTEDDRGRLFAFFNSGEHSGASQAHRHVQFLPVEDIEQGVGAANWVLLLDEIVKSATSRSGEIMSSTALPFAHFGLQLPENATPDLLHMIYKRLYETAAAAVRQHMESNPGDLQFHRTEGGALPISYNLGMTTKHMFICPRRRESITVKRDDGSDIDSVAVNGTMLGGTLMVKNEELYHFLRADSARLEAVLECVGIPSLTGKPNMNL